LETGVSEFPEAFEAHRLRNTANPMRAAAAAAALVAGSGTAEKPDGVAVPEKLILSNRTGPDLV
jgi:hypothetical protein